jgi:hypothetical protein
LLASALLTVVGGSILALLVGRPWESGTTDVAASQASPAGDPVQSSAQAANAGSRPAAQGPADAHAPTAGLPAPPARPSEANDPSFFATHDAAVELERAWPEVAARCPYPPTVQGDRPGARQMMLLLRFNGDGEEIGRTFAGSHGPTPGPAACFLADSGNPLRIKPPGREVEVTVPAPSW